MSYTIVAPPSSDNGTGYEGIAKDDNGVFGSVISGTFNPFTWGLDVGDGDPAAHGYTKIYDFDQPDASFDGANSAYDAAWTPGVSMSFIGPDGGLWYRDESAWYR